MVIKSEDKIQPRLFIKNRRKESNSTHTLPNKSLNTSKINAQAGPQEMTAQVALNIGVGKKTYDSAEIAKNFMESQPQTNLTPDKDPGLW